MPFTSFCELPGYDHFTFVPAVVLVYHLSLEVELSFIGSVLLFYMANYTFREYADMILYGEAWRNERAAPQLYEERFPHRKRHSHALYGKVYQQDSETGYIHRQQVRMWSSTAAASYLRAKLHVVEEDATRRNRRVARSLNVNQITVWRILHNQLLHPYHPREYRQCV